MKIRPSWSHTASAPITRSLTRSGSARTARLAAPSRRSRIDGSWWIRASFAKFVVASGGRLRAAATPLALGKEPTVADRGAGLRDQGLEDLVSVALEVEGLLGHQHEDTDDRLLVQDRQRVQAQESVGGIPVAREHRRFAKVVGLDGLGMERDAAGDPLTVREARPGVPRADRRIGARAE